MYGNFSQAIFQGWIWIDTAHKLEISRSFLFLHAER